MLDGRLDAAARQRVERHLEACASCRLERDAILRTKTSAARALGPKDLAPEMTAEIRSVLDREDSEGARRLRPPSAAARHLWVPAAAIGIAALMIGLALLLPGRRNLASRVAQDYENYKTERLPLPIRTENPKELERYFAARGVSFPTRVLDLRMMGYHLVGGRVLNPDGRKRALFVYRGPNAEVLACQMFEGDVRRLPKGATLRRNGDFTFFVYRSRGSTQVFWQEGRVVCVLVSDIPEEEVIQLAFAKAMKA